MSAFNETAVSLLENGNDINAVLERLRADGATALECIAALTSIGIEQDDAQQLVAASPVWADLFKLARMHKRA